jgi:hypothetical protein
MYYSNNTYTSNNIYMPVLASTWGNLLRIHMHASIRNYPAHTHTHTHTQRVNISRYASTYIRSICKESTIQSFRTPLPLFRSLCLSRYILRQVTMSRQVPPLPPLFSLALSFSLSVYRGKSLFAEKSSRDQQE